MLLDRECLLGGKESTKEHNYPKPISKFSRYRIIWISGKLYIYKFLSLLGLKLLFAFKTDMGAVGPSDMEMSIISPRTSSSGDEGELVRKGSEVADGDSGNKV